jgi:hypothetical protein
MDQPAPQMDEFRETPAAPGEAARGMPQISSSPRMREVQYTAETPVPFNPDFPALMQQPQRQQYSRWEMTPEGEAERADQRRRDADEERNRIATSERISRELGQQPGYVAPRDSTSAPANRLIDSAMSVVTGQPIAQTQPSPQTLTGQAANSAPAAAPAEEVTEPGFYGEQGRILQQALDSSRAATQGSSARAAAPARRAAPAASVAAPQQAAAQASQPWYASLFSGPAVQSNSQQVVQRSQNMQRQGEERPMTRLNWGDSDSAADFFRADRARQELEKNKEEFTGMKRGGAAGGGHHKDAVVMKALEIIHHMLRGR